MIPLWVWLLVILIIILIWWIWKHVLVPAVNVTVDKVEYDVTEKVVITGDVSQGGTPLPGKTVSFAIEPPVGDAYTLPNATTDADGLFGVDPVIEWEVPDDAVAGVYTLTATCLGVSGIKTFRQIQMRIVLRM